jgi:hypothetical protein
MTETKRYNGLPETYYESHYYDSDDHYHGYVMPSPDDVDRSQRQLTEMLAEATSMDVDEIEGSKEIMDVERPNAAAWYYDNE